MEVRKSDGSFEEYDDKKLKNIIRKVYRKAKVEYTKAEINGIVDGLYIYDGILCSSIRTQLEEKFKSINSELYKAYTQAKKEADETADFVSTKKKFIENYKKSSNTANATIDDNSNVGNKNVGVLNAEIHKPENIKISRDMIKDKLKELYPNFNAKKYVQDIDNHLIYKHDESSFSGAIAPYTYSAKEVVEILYNSKNLMLPLDLLYDIIDEEEILVDKENEVYQKLPWNLFVKDSENKYTKITHITKKKRHRDLVRIKTAFGEDIVVTDNHPLIVDNTKIDNTVPASESEGLKQYKINTRLTFKGRKVIDMAKLLPSWVETGSEWIKMYGSSAPMKRFIDIDEKLGYIIGFFIGDGNYSNTSKSLNFTQKDKEVLTKINEYLFEKFNVIGRIRKEAKIEKYTLSVFNLYVYDLFRTFFKIQDKAQNKVIPYNVLEFNEDFALGILAGIVDSDGTMANEKHAYNIRLSSRACIMQCTALFRHFGYSVGNEMQSLPFSNNDSYNTNYTIWGVMANMRSTSTSLKLSFKSKDCTPQENTRGFKYKTDGEAAITKVQRIEDESAFLKQNEYIYDITTETHTFELNNLLVHNCTSITMYPFLTNGIKNIGGLSATPKNIDSYCGMYCNLIFNISAQYAGAVATSEALLYFTYFAKKEWGDDFYLHADSIYKVGPKLRNLMNKSHYWCDTVTELAKHDFGSEDLNLLRDEIIKDTEKPLTEEQLKDFVEHVKKDPNYSIKLGDGSRTIRSQIYQYWQQIVYSINQPAGSRGLQSPFTNFSYFDKPFFEGMFGDFVFPDGTKPDWESLKWIEKEFMMWFNRERLKCIMAFPVESFTLLYKDGKFEDEEMFQFVCDEYARGHSFFTYISDTVDSLSSCCFKGDEEITVQKDGKTETLPIKDFVERFTTEADEFGKQVDTGYQTVSYDAANQDFENAKITGVLKKECSEDLYQFIVDNKEINVTPDHIMVVRNKKTDEILYLPAEYVYKNSGDYEIGFFEE